MNDACPSKSDHMQLSAASAHPWGVILKAQDTAETARHLITHAHQVMDTTRQLITIKKELLHCIQARRAPGRANGRPRDDRAP
jgi:hypothetical protein